MTTPRPVAVIGAGVMGLTTALQLKRKYPSLEVKLVADRDISATTSYGSGGWWKPTAIPGTSPADVERWGTATYKHLLSVHRSADALAAGVIHFTAFLLYSQQVPESPHWRHVVNGFRSLSSRDLVDMGYTNPPLAGGFAFESLAADQSYYLPWLMRQLLEAGVTFHEKHLRSLDNLHDLGGPFLAVFNCAGLGAGELVQDDQVIPIRGQVLKVHAPHIKHYTGLDDKYYVIPNIDTVVVGGTQQVGNASEQVTKEDRDHIMQRVTSMWPALTGVRVGKEWAGLRPARRTGVRIDRETVCVGGHDTPMIHNYGHGGSGVTLHWGCVQEALQLAEDLFETAAPKPGLAAKL